MRRRVGAIGAIVVLAALIACQPTDEGIWFEGGWDAARAEARERGTLVMVQFTTDWCSWCRRLEADIRADRDVRREIEGLVAIRRDAEKDGRDLARRFDVVSYPTIVFANPDGREVDRIVGYRPPDTLAADIRRVRTGDTFVACLRRLAEDPSDVDAVRRAVDGLLERADPEGAIVRVEAFHRASGDDQRRICRKLMFDARTALFERVYDRLGTLYERGFDERPELPDAAAFAHLAAAVSVDLLTLPPSAQARRLRQARHEDAADLLAPYRDGDIPLEEVGEVADFAFRNGHYRLAADAYRTWFERSRENLSADQLNQGAWQLYLARTDLDLAVEMARTAWARERDPDIADTLGRILYALGDDAAALEYQRRAVETARDGDRDFYLDAAERMAAGEPLADRPPFELYPGPRETSL